MIHALTFATYAITLDGRPVMPRARAAVVDGRVLLPVRALGNALNADVGYDGRSHTITVQRGARVATISARGAVRVVNGSAYAPLRSVATAFGLNVAYQARTRTVALDDRVGELMRPVHATAPVPAPPGATQPATYAIALTPASGASVHDPYPAITARFAGVTSIDPRSLRVSLDGRDVSAEAAVVGDEVLLTPRRALAPGTHTVTVDARDVGGAVLAQQWSFADDFAFAAPPPPPTPYPIQAIWIDRWIAPGTSAFDVYVEGAPGMTGYVGVDGVAGIFPLTVYSGNAYVAHVFVPSGVYQPFARVAARITLPNGQPQLIVLPQTINLLTPQKPLGTAGYPGPSPAPTSHSAPRFPLSGRSPLPRAAVPTPTPAPPQHTPSPVPHRVFEQPAASPTPQTTRLLVPMRTASPSPTPAPERTPAPRRRVPLARPAATPQPTPAPTPTPKPPA